MNQRLLTLAFLACPLAAQVKLDDATYARIKSEELEHSQTMHTLHVLTDRYGPRLTGSPNFEDAANWVVKQMTEWGFKNAHLEPWDFGHPGWLNKRAEGYMVTPHSRRSHLSRPELDAFHERNRERVRRWKWKFLTDRPLLLRKTRAAAAGPAGPRFEPAYARRVRCRHRRDPVEGERQDRSGRQGGGGAGEFRIRRALRRGEGDGRGGLRRTRRARHAACSRPEPHDRGCRLPRRSTSFLSRRARWCGSTTPAWITD